MTNKATLRRLRQDPTEPWFAALARENGMEVRWADGSTVGMRTRLALFRAHHGRSIDAASPFVLDLLSHAGFDPDDVAWRLGPDGRWPRWLCGPRWLRGGRHVGRPRGPLPAMSEDAMRRAAFLYGGGMLEQRVGRVAMLGARFSPWGLEIAATLGAVSVRTLGGSLIISTRNAVPEVVKLAAVGRTAGDLFDHPCLSDPRYVIVAQTDQPATYAPDPVWTAIVRTGRAAWRAPWSPTRPVEALP